MAGNVWEWTSDGLDDAKSTKVLRGGSWYSGRDFARCVFRGRDDLFGRNYFYVGFRCVRTKK